MPVQKLLLALILLLLFCVLVVLHRHGAVGFLQVEHLSSAFVLWLLLGRRRSRFVCSLDQQCRGSSEGIVS